MRILTHNIHKGMSAWNRRHVLHALREEIRECGADIVLLQEVQGEHRRKAQRVPDWPTEAQFEFLADRMWPHHAYARNAVYPQGHHGNAILSRHPIRRAENLNLSGVRWASRSILHAVVEPDATEPVHVLCVHFGLGEGERTQQTSALIERVRNHVPEEAPLVIGGDFNDWHGAASQQLERTLGLCEGHKACHGRYARTFPSWMPVLRVDRIFLRGLRPLTCARGPSHRWQGLSDHLPLLCDVAQPDGKH